MLLKAIQLRVKIYLRSSKLAVLVLVRGIFIDIILFLTCIVHVAIFLGLWFLFLSRGLLLLLRLFCFLLGV